MGSSAGAKRARSLLFSAAFAAMPAGTALAFPLIESSTQGSVPSGTDLSGADVQDLAHHMQLLNGPLVAPSGGWAFQARLDAQEALTDNVYLANSPRQWDLITFIAPGFTAAADKGRLQLYFTFQPVLAMHVNAGSLNSLTQNYSGTALATLVDDLLYLDVRAVAGVGSLYGSVGGIGGIGANSVASTTAASFYGVGSAGAYNKNNLVQNSGLSISPYLVRRLGDYGNIRLGYSFSMSHTETITGFIASPFPTGGANQQTYLSNEEYFHYDTGDMFSSVVYSFDANGTQGLTGTNSGFYQAATGLPQVGPSNYNNSNYSLNNTLTWQINQTVSVYGSAGWQSLTYNNQQYQGFNGITWNVGTTLTPGPDTLLSLGYGYNNGYYSFNMNGYYRVTARTSINAAYYSSLGTQLQYLQSQLGLATGPTLVNGTNNNGGQLFVANNLLSPQEGVFRFDTFTFGAQTNLDRDIFAANVALTKSSQQGANAAPSSTATSFNITWTHELQEDLILTAAAAYNTSNQTATLTSINPGWSHAFITSAAIQYQISPTLGATLRYSFFDRISENSQNNAYQNMLVLGVSKTF